jgi:hypothetical protein
MPPNERLNGGKLISSYSPINSRSASAPNGPRQLGQCGGGIGRFAQFTRMAFVSGLGAAGLGLLAPLFSIRRWRFGRRARSLVRTLKPKHQLDQIVLAQPLQIIAIHPNLESATRPTRKGWVITSFLHTGTESLNTCTVNKSRYTYELINTSKILSIYLVKFKQFVILMPDTYP